MMTCRRPWTRLPSSKQRTLPRMRSRSCSSVTTTTTICSTTRTTTAARPWPWPWARPRSVVVAGGVTSHRARLLPPHSPTSTTTTTAHAQQSPLRSGNSHAEDITGLEDYGTNGAGMDDPPDIVTSRRSKRNQWSSMEEDEGRRRPESDCWVAGGGAGDAGDADARDAADPASDTHTSESAMEDDGL